MLFYKKARVYYSLESLSRAHLGAPFVVQIDLGKSRCFSAFSSVEDFKGWYRGLLSSERTVSEVVFSRSRKLFLDIDSPRSDSEMGVFRMYDFVRHVRSRIMYVFAELDIGYPEVLSYDICDDSKISYHFVVQNFLFSAETCLGLCMLVSEGQVWESLADVGVYKRIQSIRVEGSTKYGEKRWKRLYGPEPPTYRLECGLVSAVDGVEESGLELVPRRGARTCFSGLPPALPCFRVRHVSGEYIFLDRTRASMCVQCRRVHTRENAVIRCRDYAFLCWRYITS